MMPIKRTCGDNKQWVMFWCARCPQKTETVARCGIPDGWSRYVGPTGEAMGVICPTCAALCAHTPSPNGYTEKAAWFKRMGNTHKVERCPNCGLFAMWVPKKAQPADPKTKED